MEPHDSRGGAACLLGSLDQTTPPINVVAVAARCGLAIQYRDDLPAQVAGFLYRGPLWDVIVVNALHPHVRQRFTIAHQIGHRWCGDSRVSCREVHLSYSWECELAADAFASELLMPEPLVLEEWNRCRGLSALAHRFEVSEAAMARRLHELRLYARVTSSALPAFERRGSRRRRSALHWFDTQT